MALNNFIYKKEPAKQSHTIKPTKCPLPQNEMRKTTVKVIKSKVPAPPIRYDANGIPLPPPLKVPLQPLPDA